MENTQTVERITFYETGRALVASWGLWNSPRDGYAARPSYWAPVPDEIVGAIPALYAGEWIDQAAECTPEFARSLKARFEQADKLSRPWAY